MLYMVWKPVVEMIINWFAKTMEIAGQIPTVKRANERIIIINEFCGSLIARKPKLVIN